MAFQEELDKVYQRVNTIESKVDETNGYLSPPREGPERQRARPFRGGKRVERARI